MTPTPKNPDAERLALADELELCANSCEVYSPDQCATLIDGIGWIAMRHKLTRAAEQLRALEQPAQVPGVVSAYCQINGCKHMEKREAVPAWQWQPIETCPNHIVLLHVPEHEGFPWSEIPMPGMRDKAGFVVYTPYKSDGKGVVCPLDATPLGWMLLPTRTLPRAAADYSDYRYNPAKLAEWLRVHFRAKFPAPEFRWIYEALHTTPPPDVPEAVKDAWWAVGRFRSSPEPNRAVLKLSVGSEIESDERHHSFIEWVYAHPSAAPRPDKENGND